MEWQGLQAPIHQISINQYFDSIIHRSVPIMLNFMLILEPHFSVIWAILQYFASKISKNTEKSIYLEALEWHGTDWFHAQKRFSLVPRPMYLQMQVEGFETCPQALFSEGKVAMGCKSCQHRVRSACSKFRTGLI